MDRFEATVMDYPPHSPDFVILDFHPFPKLNERLKGHHYALDNEVKMHTSIVMDS
jgi:hypothetical protein